MIEILGFIKFNNEEKKNLKTAIEEGRTHMPSRYDVELGKLCKSISGKPMDRIDIFGHRTKNDWNKG